MAHAITRNAPELSTNNSPELHHQPHQRAECENDQRERSHASRLIRLSSGTRGPFGAALWATTRVCTDRRLALVAWFQHAEMMPSPFSRRHPALRAPVAPGTRTGEHGFPRVAAPVGLEIVETGDAVI